MQVHHGNKYEDPPNSEVPDVKDVKPVSNNVQDILKRLQSTGALLKKPKQEYKCRTCDEDFPDWEELEQHLITHVSLPSVVIDKLPSDEEDNPGGSGDDWSDEEEEAPEPQPKPQKTPQKIDISQIMKNPGLCIKKPGQAKPTQSSDSALSKLSGLGFTIKKGNTPIKQESDSNQEKKDPSDVMKKLGNLGGIKLKLKSDGAHTNSFKVVNGLKDFKTSDDEEEDNEAEKDDEKGEESGEDQADKEGNDDDSADENEQAPDAEKQSDDEDEEEIPLATRKINNAIKNAMKKKLEKPNEVKIEKPEPAKKPEPVQVAKQTQPTKPPGRPAVKQTPRRGANHPLGAKQTPPTQGMDVSTTSTPERRESNPEPKVEEVVVKKEVDTVSSDAPSSTMPLFSNQIKTERSSPSPNDAAPISTPIIAQVKTETDAVANEPKQEPLFQNTSNSAPVSQAPLLPVTKTEDSMTIIEINGDSDGDDDCCVVSATPAPDVKPVIPKTETISASYPAPTFSTSQPSFTTAPVLTSRLTAMPSDTHKQHSFNWNAPDSKPPLDMLEKSTDDLFDSLMSSAKRENSSLIGSDAEYISLDTLGPQHSCERTLEQPAVLWVHLRLITRTQAQVACRLASSKRQIYVQPWYARSANAGQMPGQMPGQYPGQNFMGQPTFGQQFQQTPSSKPGGYIPTSSPYSTSSPLQGMQQAVYGQSMMNNQMGPPGSTYVAVSSPSGMKPPTSSGVRIQNVQTFAPGQFNAQGQQMTSGDMGQQGQMGMGQGQMGMGQGQMGMGQGQMGMGQGQTGMGSLSQPQVPGQQMGNQMPAPGPIRMAAGANITGTRPRMANVRGVRPTIRPGIQVHGQVRGAKPRMPMKRPAGAAPVQGQKRRNDMLLPGKHDNEDCQVMSMQKQREGLPMIQSVQGAKDKLNLGSQISITKKAVPKSNAMASMLASRGISVKQKPKSRSPSPERPVPHIPNLGSGVSIKHTSKSSNFSIPEASVGGGINTCKICRKGFMNSSSLAVHMANVHPSAKVNVFKCDECPASYPKSLQLQHHKRVFHNVQGQTEN
ncbi:hypothetical protein NE865_14595 [Phthorimaea operculella]|nr:hypothetical protein NE865_14595 [Phthorimaea operculella]